MNTRLDAIRGRAVGWMNMWVVVVLCGRGCACRMGCRLVILRSVAFVGGAMLEKEIQVEGRVKIASIKACVEGRRRGMGMDERRSGIPNLEGPSEVAAPFPELTKKEAG